MRKLKKAFTIVELVIVIAVIAILAAVLIPTFSNMILKSHLSSDLQLVRNLNMSKSIYCSHNGNISTESDLNNILISSGIKELKAESSNYGYFIFYDLENECFVLSTLNDEPLSNNQNNVSVAYESNIISDIVDYFSNEPVLLKADNEITELLNGNSKLTDNVFRTSLKENYYLVDNAGSDLVNAISILESPKSLDDYKNAVQKIYSYNLANNNAFIKLQDIVEQTIIFNEIGSFSFDGIDLSNKEVNVYLSDSLSEHNGIIGDLKVHYKSNYSIIDVEERDYIIDNSINQNIIKLHFNNNVNIVGSKTLIFGENSLYETNVEIEFDSIKSELDVVNNVKAFGTNAVIKVENSNSELNSFYKLDSLDPTVLLKKVGEDFCSIRKRKS